MNKETAHLSKQLEARKIPHRIEGNKIFVKGIHHLRWGGLTIMQGTTLYVDEE